MLLDVDGLNKRWKKGVKSAFQGELGWHTSNDIETYAPLIFRRVNGGVNNRQLDLCPVGGNDFAYDDVEEIPDDHYFGIRIDPRRQKFPHGPELRGLVEQVEREGEEEEEAFEIHGGGGS